MTTTEQTPRELPERFSCVTTKPKDGNMRSAAGGDYVRYSDYAALATRLAESEARAEAWKAFAEHQVHCAECAESVESCADGRELRDAAIAQEAEREAASAWTNC